MFRVEMILLVLDGAGNELNFGSIRILVRVYDGRVSGDSQN